MAARKVPLHRAWTPDKVRERIKTTLIVKALSDHVLNGKEMSKSQISAGIALLRKTLPDLTAVAHSGSVELVKPDELSDADLAHIAAGGRARTSEPPAGPSESDEVH